VKGLDKSMTEQRSPYQAFSGDYSTNKSTITDTSPLVQHSTDGTTTRDSILLLPVLRSPQSGEEPATCMHFVHLKDGGLSFCNIPDAPHCCACCGRALCSAHACMGPLTVPGDSGTWCDMPEACLCETCFHFPQIARSALHVLWRMINSGKGQVW
jgi:hypothetical protein